MPHWPTEPFADVIRARGSGTAGLPQSEWRGRGEFPVIGQGEEYIEGWTDREDLAIRPAPALVLYGGHTRRAKFVDRPFVPGPNVKILEPARTLDAKFLFYYLMQVPIKSRGYADHFPEVRRCTIPIPSLAEQKRIAAILDKADAIRRRRQEAARLADTLGLAALVHIAGDPIINPHSWQMQPLQVVCSTITDGEHLNPLFTSNGVPMVMAANVREDGVDLINTKCISEEDYERFTRKCNPQRNDVLVVSRGATIGRCTRVDTDHRFALMGSVILLKLDQGRMLSTYLQVLLTHPAYRARLFTTSSASAQQAIYLSHIKKLLVPVPPMAIQREHCRFVEWVDAHSARMRAERESVEELFASLVQRAFRGEL